MFFKKGKKTSTETCLKIKEAKRQYRKYRYKNIKEKLGGKL